MTSGEIYRHTRVLRFQRAAGKRMRSYAGHGVPRVVFLLPLPVAPVPGRMLCSECTVRVAREVPIDHKKVT